MSIWQELTDMIKDGDVNAEMVKKFKDTIIKIRTSPDEPWTFVKYYGWNGVGHLVYGLVTDNEIVLTKEDNLEIRIPYLAYGCYTNHKTKQMMIGMSLPWRQWKKGMCDRNTAIRYFHDATNRFKSDIHEILMGDQSKITLDEGLKRLEGNYVSTAINRDWGISLDFLDDTDNICLFYKSIPVGVVDKETKSIVLAEKCFQQELTDSARTWCHNWSVM